MRLKSTIAQVTGFHASGTPFAENKDIVTDSSDFEDFDETDPDQVEWLLRLHRAETEIELIRDPAMREAVRDLIDTDGDGDAVLDSMEAIVESLEEFEPTHRITFVPRNGSPETTIVMLSDDDNGAAYSFAEWHCADTADWSCVDGEWSFQGQAAPRSGEVHVEELT